MIGEAIYELSPEGKDTQSRQQVLQYLLANNSFSKELRRNPNKIEHRIHRKLREHVNVAFILPRRMGKITMGKVKL